MLALACPRSLQLASLGHGDFISRILSLTRSALCADSPLIEAVKRGNTASPSDASGPFRLFLTDMRSRGAVALEAPNLQIEKVADELVPLPAGLSAVADQDRLPDFVG